MNLFIIHFTKNKGHENITVHCVLFQVYFVKPCNVVNTTAIHVKPSMYQQVDNIEYILCCLACAYTSLLSSSWFIIWCYSICFTISYPEYLQIIYQYQIINLTLLVRQNRYSRKYIRCVRLSPFVRLDHADVQTIRPLIACYNQL